MLSVQTVDSNLTLPNIVNNDGNDVFGFFGLDGGLPLEFFLMKIHSVEFYRIP